MKRLFTGCLALLLMVGGLTVTTTAQRAKPRPRATKPAVKPATATATPTPTPPTPAQTSTFAQPPDFQEVPLAKVNGAPIYLHDLNPDVQKAVAQVDKNIEQLRLDALQAQVNSLLLEAEAAKRNTTTDALVEQEVNSRVQNPTDAEVQTFYDANRAQIGNNTLADVRPQIVRYMRQQQVGKLTEDLAKRLRDAFPVQFAQVNLNAALPAKTVLVTAAGKTLTVGEFNERLKPLTYRLQRDTWTAESNDLDERINTLLLEAEARRRNVTPQQILQEEIGNKLTEAEIAKV